MQGRQGIAATGRLSSWCPQQLNYLCFCPVSIRGVAYTWERAARGSIQLRREFGAATSLSRWIRCSDPQASGRSRGSILPCI